jgi:hypothetical protein
MAACNMCTCIMYVFLVNAGDEVFTLSVSLALVAQAPHMWLPVSVCATALGAMRVLSTTHALAVAATVVLVKTVPLYASNTFTVGAVRAYVQGTSDK